MNKENVQRSPLFCAPGLVKFVPAVAYHFCLALPAAFTQPGAHLLAKPCTAPSEVPCPDLRRRGLQREPDDRLGVGLGQPGEL